MTRSDDSLFGRPIIHLGTAPDTREEDDLAFKVAFIAGRHGVDPVWYAKWLEPLVSPAPEPGYEPVLEQAVKRLLGRWHA